MAIREKTVVGTLLSAMLLVCMVLVPAASAQENEYSVTAEKAFEHANAQMISYAATDAQIFGEWKGASIDPKPLELHDINGKKLLYQFSVYNNGKTIGKINVCADKTLGQSVQSIYLDPKPFNATDVMKKSIEIATNKYPAGKIKSTNMVVYSYPSIGAMTVVKDKTTGDEHWVIVDVYTLDVIQDKSATGTEPGVWSMYEKLSKNGLDENLKEWQKSDKFTKYIEQEATSKGDDISIPIAEEKMKTLSSDAAIASTTTTVTLNSVPLYGQETSYYCGPASAQMISKYYNVVKTQTTLFNLMHGDTNGVYVSDMVYYYTLASSLGGLGKTHSYSTNTGLTFNTAVSEINSNRPFTSRVYHGVTGNGHFRVGKGYQYNIYGLQYLILNDPWPVGSGGVAFEGIGLETHRIYMRS